MLQVNSFGAFIVFSRKHFLQIGHYFYTYRSFLGSLRPCQQLDSQVMGVWIEKFNRESALFSGKNACAKKKYAFSFFMTVSEKLHSH
jgi:hypothetical protein